MTAYQTCPINVVYQPLLDELTRRHHRMLGSDSGSENHRDYALDIRNYLATPPDTVDREALINSLSHAYAARPEVWETIRDLVHDDALLSDCSELSLTEVRERAVAAMGDVLGRADPIDRSRGVTPTAASWWLSVSADGRIASQVDQYLQDVTRALARGGERAAEQIRNKLNIVSNILSACERALKAAASYLTGVDVEASLSGLIENEAEAALMQG